MHATVCGAGSAAGYARNPGELVRKPVNAQTEDNVPVKAHNPACTPGRIRLSGNESSELPEYYSKLRRSHATFRLAAPLLRHKSIQHRATTRYVEVRQAKFIKPIHAAFISLEHGNGGRAAGYQTGRPMHRH